MKNAMSYFYNLIPSSIHQRGKIYYFYVNQSPYVLIPCDNVAESQIIYEFSMQLLKIGLPIHQIILNNQSQVVTKINQDDYVLMKIFVPKREVQLEDIIQFNQIPASNLPNSLRRDDWYILWTKKIDYFEYQISQIGKKYPIIIDSFSYYVGLAENAIILMQMISQKPTYVTLNHRRIAYGDTTYKLFNPFNLIIDVRIRDVCDYLKSCFFQNKNIDLLLQQYLYSAKLSQEELQCFFARMLFPTYYFDAYEKIIAGEMEEKELLPIIAKVDAYETLLRRIYRDMAGNGMLPEIEWLKKITPSGN